MLVARGSLATKLPIHITPFLRRRPRNPFDEMRVLACRPSPFVFEIEVARLTSAFDGAIDHQLPLGQRNPFFQMHSKPRAKQSRFSRKFSGLEPGWGGRTRTSEWRNQNLLDYPIISMGIWEKSVKTGSSNFNGLAPFSK
jgi:hypothetical protein